MLRPMLVLTIVAATASAQEVPLSADPWLEVRPFAAAPEIVHPIALDFDAKGRLLVVESHTYFRPANYAGSGYVATRCNLLANRWCVG